MNKELILTWLAALRSGEYTQGQQVLRWNSDSYCCLGVLCDVSKRGHWIPSGDAYAYVTWDDSSMFTPSDYLLDAVGLSIAASNYSAFPLVIHDESISVARVLTHFNDHLNMSFVEIADVLEKYYVELGVLDDATVARS